MPMKRKISLSILFLLCACHHAKQQENLVLIQIQDRNGLSETISNPDRLSSYTTVDFETTQPYKKVVRVYRNEGKNRSVITTYHANGTHWQYLEAKEMRAFGAFKEWFPSGARKIEATVIGGSAELSIGGQESWLFDGSSFVWNENGQLIASILYDKGVLSGLSTYFYPSGAKEKEIPYVQDLIEGELTEYWETGQIRAKTAYRNNLPDGMSQSFWPNQTLRSEEKYEEGQLRSGHYRNLCGETVSEVNDGAGFRALFSSTRLIQLQEVKKGQIEGFVKNFDAAGTVQSSFYMKNGKKHGEEIEYYSSKETSDSRLVPKISISWDQDAIHGHVKTWYPNEQMQSQKEMCRNKRNGTSCSWYLNGSLMLVEEYENDILRKGQYFRKNQTEPISTITNGNGVATIFDEEGSLLRKVIYSNGKMVDPE
ncbi:MAG: hypothetical protein HW387_1685 [Parachlamydiales bacterium]|nr:hypothetical protein [Parachlamydiales bacterium]